MADEPFNTLLSVLRDRDIQYDRNALEAAYNDPESQTAIQEWIQEYLTPETLLTKDEAILYSTLVKNGEADRLAAQDLSMVEGVTDREIRDAIEELKRSTASIEKQTEALRLQQNAMGALVKSEQRTVHARAHSDQEQLRRWEAERGQISREVDELSQSLAYQISDLEQQSKEAEASVKQTVDSVLRADDKLLLSLQKLAADLDPEKPETHDTINRIKELCARLIKHTVEGVRTRLDRVYLEALKNSNMSNGQGTEKAEVVDLQEELESLYAEILPVAQMSAEQQFLEPALRVIAATDGQGQERAVKAFKYINDCLLFLINRIDILLQRAEESRCHNMALKTVLAAAKKELLQTSLIKTPTSPVKSNTPRRRKSSTPQSPLKVRNLRRRSSGSVEGLEPEQQLARNLGISIPADSDSEQARIEALEQVLSDRLTKLGLHSENLQSSTETSISSYLQNAHATLQLLQDSLLAETSFHTVRFLDPELVGSVDTFEDDVLYVQKSMEEIDLQVLQGKNVGRDQIVERWSR